MAIRYPPWWGLGALAAGLLLTAVTPTLAQAQAPQKSQISSSSWATISACGTSVRTIAA